LKNLVKVLAAAAACACGFLGYVYLTLPDVTPLASANPATTAFIELRADEARARGAEPRRVQRWVPYARIAGSLKRAVLVAEDGLFFEHDGIDVQQIRESLERDLKAGALTRGGSTITQQLAKNLYLSPSKNPVRKLRELLIARRLEASLTKTRILDLYLNVIEWGDGIYGAEAAARTYFRKPASALTADESALLAGCIINPRIMNPSQPTPRLARRQKLILGRMGVVTPPPDAAGTVQAPDATGEPSKPIR
jgi:monofunctional biosynthetic peptidoglycan transglycosylase